MKKILAAILLVLLCISPVYAEKFTFKKGATSQSIYFSVWDASSTTGAKLTGLTYNSASLVCYYNRVLGLATQIVLATQSTPTADDPWVSAYFIEVSSANQPGRYRLDIPDAVIATGVNRAFIDCKGASNMVPVTVDIELVDYDPQDAVRLGLTALPNVASGSAGAIPTTGTGANQISVSSGRVGIDLDNTAGTLQDADIDTITANPATGGIVAGSFGAGANNISASEVRTQVDEAHHTTVQPNNPVAGSITDILRQVKGARCAISAATSGSSFTISSCVDHDNNAITLATDNFTGIYLEAINRGASQCNVVGQSVFVESMTSGGVVTVRTADIAGAKFPATPNTSNCNVRLKP